MGVRPTVNGFILPFVQIGDRDFVDHYCGMMDVADVK